MSGSKEAIFAGSVVPFQPSGKRPSIMCTSSWSAKVSAGYGGRAQFGTGTEKSALGDVAHRLGALFEMGEKLVEVGLSTLAHAAQKQSQQRGQKVENARSSCSNMAADRDKKVSIGRRPARDKGLTIRAAAARSACFVKLFEG